MGDEADVWLTAGRTCRRAELSRRLREMLPARGMLACGAGSQSSPWRVIADLDTARLIGQRTPPRATGAAPPETVDRRLRADEIAQLTAFAAAILTGTHAAQQVRSMDSVGLLVVVAGDRAFELAPPGPITEGAPATLHRQLYQLGWPSPAPPDETPSPSR